MSKYNLVIIGAGAAGILCAIKASKQGVKSILLIEKEPLLGGALSTGDYNISKDNLVTGIQYKEKLLKELESCSNITVLLDTMALKIDDNEEVVITSEKGIEKIKGKNIILTNGAKEGSREAVKMVGDRCSGIYTLGMAKKILDIDNMVPGKKILIYGNDTLYMLEKSLKKHSLEIAGIVTDRKDDTFGLTDKIYKDHEIVDIKGKGRVDEVTLSNGNSKVKIKCDTVIFAKSMLSDGLVAMRSGINLNLLTSGPKVDDKFMTSRENIYACGNGVYIHESIEDIEKECIHVIRNILKHK